MTAGKAATTVACLVALLGSVVWIIKHGRDRKSGSAPKINLVSRQKK